MAKRKETSEIARTVDLKSGGSITVAAVVDLARLSPDDREFVFLLLDRLAEYEKPAPTGQQGRVRAAAEEAARAASAAIAGQVTP